MKRITLAGSPSRALKLGFTFFLLCSFGAFAQQTGKMSEYSSKWQKGGMYSGFKPEQEILEKRTKNSKHFRNANGTITAQVGKKQHYLDNTGAWQDISVDIKNTGTAFVNDANEFKTRFPLQANTAIGMKVNGVDFAWWGSPKMQLSLKGNVIKSYNPAAVTGIAGNGKLHYAGIYPGVTEEFVMLHNGVENNTIIQSLTPDMRSAQSGAVMQMSQFVPMKPDWKLETAEGVAGKGTFETEAFHINIPGTAEGIYFGRIVAFDNALKQKEALAILNMPEGKRTAAQKELVKRNIYVGKYTINVVNGGIEVITSIPVAWLNSAGRAFPVTIDPTVTITPPGVTSWFYGPLTHWYGWQRTANLYLESELNTGPAAITAIEYYINTETDRVKPLTVYMKTSALETLPEATWDSPDYIGGLTPLYDDNYAQVEAEDWNMISFGSPFIYTGGNLMVMVKDIYGGFGNAQYINTSEGEIEGRQTASRQDGSDPGESDDMVSDDDDGPYLAEIRITYSAASTGCDMASGITFSNVTATGATVSWTAPAAAPSNGYQYVVSTSASSPGDTPVLTGTTAAGVTTANITLTSGLTYYFWLRSDCGDQKSYWFSGSITAPCAVYTAPFTETFSTGTKPFCWTNQSTVNTGNALWKFGGFVEHDTGNTRPEGTFAWVDGSDPSEGVNDVTLTSPAINLTGLAAPQLVFDYFSNTSDTEVANNILTAEVYDGMNWAVVFSDDTNSPAWRTATVSLAAYVGQTIQVRFILDKTAAEPGYAFYNDVLLDNVLVQQTPTCAPPSGVYASDVTPLELTVNWTAAAAAPSGGYDYELRTSGAAGSGASGLVASGNVPNAQSSQLISGLTPDTDYIFYIRSNCGGTDFSNWVSADVATIPVPPVNDECAGAIALTVNADYACAVVTAGTTVAATESMESDPCYGNPDDDVWYSFVATGDKHSVSLLDITTVVGTSTDMYIQVLSGTCDAFESLACSDPNSVVVSDLVAGETYYVRVYNYYGDQNTFNICIGSPPPPPANDDCAGAVVLTVNAGLTCTSFTSSSTVSATETMEADPCGGIADDDVWFQFTATSDVHTVSLSDIVVVEGWSTDMYIQVLEGTCDGLSSVRCSDSEFAVVEELVPGNVYYVRVYSYGDHSRENFKICVGTMPPAPANDDCAGAIALTAGGVFATNPVVVTNGGATSTPDVPAPECANYLGGDVWYTVVVPESGSITVETNANANGVITDAGLALYSGGCDAFELIECDDDDSDDGAFSLIALTNREPGEIIYIRAWEYGNDSYGTFRISAYDASLLGTTTFDAGSFRYYPNPVKDVLNLSYTSDITSVAVFNLLGQQVLTKSINASLAAIDISALADGAYIVNVSTDGAVKTIKVIKQQ